MRLKQRLLAIAALVAALGSGHPALAQLKSSFGPTTTDVSTGHAGHSSLPQALGYWKEEGLEVNVFGVNGSIAGVQLLAAGNIDFISLNGDELLTARAKGVPIKAVYMHARQPIGRFVVTEASGIKQLADLKGKTVGIPVINNMSYPRLVFGEAGLNVKSDFTVVATGTGAPALLALQRGDIAGWMSWDTAVAALENRGMKFKEFRPSFFKDLFGNVIVTREAVIKENPELVVKMTRAISKGVHFGLTNPEAAIRIHWKLYPQTRPQGGDEAKLLAEAHRVFMSRFQSYALEGTDKYGESLPEQWERAVAIGIEQGELPAGFDVKAAYTNEFIDAVNKWDRAAVAAQAKGWTGN